MLDDLRLTAEQRSALARQGFVAAEVRGGRPRYKLRFRDGGRQVVRCLGRDPARADRVRRELAALRAGSHAAVGPARPGPPGGPAGV